MLTGHSRRLPFLNRSYCTYTIHHISFQVRFRSKFHATYVEYINCKRTLEVESTEQNSTDRVSKWCALGITSKGVGTFVGKSKHSGAMFGILKKKVSKYRLCKGLVIVGSAAAFFDNITHQHEEYNTST